MKKLLILLFFPILAFAQDGIFLKDGSKLEFSKDAEIYPGTGKLYYREPDKRRKSVKFNKLDYAAWDGKLFRTVQKDGKPRGYYLLADEHSHSLAVFVQKKTKYTGGFHAPYKKYEVAELRNGEIAQDISFTNSNRDGNPEKRRDAFEMIKRNFAECNKLIERLPGGDPSDALLAFLEEVKFIACD